MLGNGRAPRGKEQKRQRNPAKGERLGTVPFSAIQVPLLPELGLSPLTGNKCLEPQELGETRAACTNPKAELRAPRCSSAPALGAFCMSKSGFSMQMLLSPSPVKLRCQHRLGPAGCKPHVYLGVNPWTARGRLGVWDGAKPSLGSAWAEPILGPGDGHRGCAARKRQLLPPKHTSSSRNGLKKSLFGSGAVQQDCAPGARPAPTGHILPLPGANGIPRGSDHHLHRACKVLWLHICLKSSAREMKAPTPVPRHSPTRAPRQLQGAGGAGLRPAGRWRQLRAGQASSSPLRHGICIWKKTCQEKDSSPAPSG